MVGTKKRRNDWVVWIVGPLLLLYPLSVGPAEWIGNQFRPFGPTEERYLSVVQAFYWPLEIAQQNCPPLRRAIDWYIRAWTQ